MKILVIIGSPKGKGNTYNTAKKVEEQITKLDKAVEFEYLLLRNANLQTCKGCFQCLKKGEEYCPIKDDQKLHKNTEKHIIKAARAFYNSLTANAPIKPSLIKLISFNLQKYAFFNADKTLADYKYWENKGWLKNNSEYYYPVKINFIKKLICKFIVKIWYLNIPKPSN